MSITGLVVTILIIILGIYDLVVVLRGGVASSVSRFLIDSGIKAPFVAFTFGFVSGHLFGVVYPDHCPPPSANILAPNFWMLSTGVTVAAYVVLWRKKV